MNAWMCEQHHPKLPEVSRFFTENKAVADEYKRLGWRITPLSDATPRLRAVLHQVMVALARCRPDDTPDGWREYEDAMNAARAAQEATAAIQAEVSATPSEQQKGGE